MRQCLIIISGLRSVLCPVLHHFMFVAKRNPSLSESDIQDQNTNPDSSGPIYPPQTANPMLLNPEPSEDPPPPQATHIVTLLYCIQKSFSLLPSFPSLPF